MTLMQVNFNQVIVTFNKLECWFYFWSVKLHWPIETENQLFLMFPNIGEITEYFPWQMPVKIEVQNLGAWTLMRDPTER